MSAIEELQVLKPHPTLFDPLPVPTFDREDELHARHIARVAGTDEAGRGPLAGPVVAGAALLPRAFAVEFFGQINDSKQLSHRARERLSAQIQQHAQWGLGLCEAAEIDQINIRRASWLAMRRAVEDLCARFGPIDRVLVDGLPVREMEWPWPYETIIRGDTLSLSIAAASIVAKVARDAMMVEFDAQFPGYGFAAHKGYPTRAHYAALRELGACAIHRRTFAPVRAAMVRAELKGSLETQ